MLTNVTSLEHFAASVNQLAPLPAVAFKVVQLAKDENTSAVDLASAIASDQALTTGVLRVANSAYIGSAREITTVRDAVVLLGMNEIRRIGLTTALMGRFNDPTGMLNLSAFWGHSMVVGLVAEVIARHTRLAPPEEAFTAGIIHDVGKLAMSLYAKEQYAEAADLATRRGMPLERAEFETFGFSHPALGQRLSEHWRFPQALQEAIAHHHAHPGEESGLSYVVSQANDLCRDHGLWCGFDDLEPGATLPDDPAAADPLRAAVLTKIGGIDKIIERANTFLGSNTGWTAGRSAPKPAAPTPLQEAARPSLAGSAAAASGGGLRSAMRQSGWAAPHRFPGRFGR